MAREEDAPQLLLENQLCFPLYAAARRIVTQYTPYLKPLGLTYTQYIVMLALWETETATVGELGQRLFLDNGTLTPLLKKLEEAGFVTRRRSSRDERVVQITVTEQGWSLREQAKAVPFRVGRCVCLEPEEARLLHRVLYKLLDGFDS